MGTSVKEEKKKGGGGKSREKKERKTRGPHAGAKIPAPPPRLRAFYQQTVRPKLQAQFGFANPHEIPGLEKIVVNVGLGEAIKQPRLLDGIVEELATITGQQPVKRRAKKSIANFGLRQGQEIGAAVTLGGARTRGVFDRFLALAITPIRHVHQLHTISVEYS